MNELSSEARQRIAKEELERLRVGGYITEDTYNHIVSAQNQYYTKLSKEKAIELARKNEARLHIEKKSVKPDITPLQVEKEKVKLSPQKIRERNITWGLNLGVILLLIGGLVLATSNWDTLAHWMKTGLIALVAGFFFGLAYLSGRILKIEKTAFAFHVLGSLFLPIIILSVAYFELLGSYFSITGEGRYIYGAIGSLLILPVYMTLSVRLKSRLFVWFSYVTVSSFAALLIAALYLPIDGFYLGIMAFNGLLILVFRYFRENSRYQLFTKEFIAFIQANLILSTLLMLMFYTNELAHGYTLILTAVLYFAMIFVTNQKEYHFVFSLMLIYGAYQVIEFSMLNEISGIAYALLGTIFLALPFAIKDNTSLQKAFRYTSAIVSTCAFLFISLEGILLRYNEPSIVLLFAYVIISFNFTFLSKIVKHRLFSYLSPVFLMAALYQAVLLGQEIFGYESLIFPMFLTGILLYIAFGCYMKLDFFKHVQASSRDIGIAVMGISIMVGFEFSSWLMLGTMFLLLSIIGILMDKFEVRKIFKKGMIATWVHGIALGLAVFFYYGEIVGNKYYFVGISGAEYFVVAGLVVLLVSFLWQRLKRKMFSKHSFFIAHAFYAYGIWHTFTPYFDEVIRAFIVFGGIGMAYLLYRRTKWPAMAFVVSGMSLVFYLTALYAINYLFDIQADLYHSLQFVMGSIFLLIVGALIEKRAIKLTWGFWWVGQLYLPIALLYSYLLYGENSLWAFIVATVIYGVSLQKVTGPLLKRTLLYACFTSFWIVVRLAMFLLEFQEYIHYSFLGTSLVIAALWAMNKGSWRRAIAYYLVPFSMLGIGVFQLVSPYELHMFIATIMYASSLLFIMHKEKWDIYNVIPLLMIFYAISIYSYGLFEVTLLAFVLTVIGFLCYPKIYHGTKSLIVIDWYTIIGFLAILNLYDLTGDRLWTKLLPGLLISANLLLQGKRVPYVSQKWMFFIAGAFLLQPYYTVLGNTSIPALIERELYVLPWIILVVFLKKVSDQQYQSIVNYTQWAVLVIVSLLLIQDGLASSTIYDALILGTLALVSILVGMSYQIKSFFFVGAGVLLLNVFLQTRPYWGNLPWWAYLLISGSILITVASYNEWHKQKSADGKTTMISIFKERIIDKIKKWE